MTTPVRGLLQAGDVLLYGRRKFKVLGRYPSTSGQEAPQARDEAGHRLCPFYSVLVKPLDDRPLPYYTERHYVEGDPPGTFRIPEAHFFVFVKAGGWRYTRKAR